MLTSRPTHGGGAPLGIDLEAGIAKITVRRPAPDTETVPEPPASISEDVASAADERDRDQTPRS